MPRLSKPLLLAKVESAIKESGWNFLYLSRGHPATYQLYREGYQSISVRVYIWNISHGGGTARAVDEFRIQVTGIDHFLQAANEKTIILGWWDDAEAFAGFDYRHHAGALGASPSIQISGDAVRRAHVNGLAAYPKENGEIAIAFRPDFMGIYVSNVEHLHDLGAPADFAMLERVAETPDLVTDTDIAAAATTLERRHVIVIAKRALREIGFRERVLTAYSHRCAMCGLQLDLLDAAHIVPVNVTNSTDETSNGIAFCALHHRAYDRSLVTFGSNFEILVNDNQVAKLAAAARDGGLTRFRTNLHAMIDLPPDRRDRPNPAYVERANGLRGW